MNSVKPGWQTTEFWMNLLAVTIAYLMSTDLGDMSGDYVLVAKVLVALAAALAALGYTASRAVVKREQLRASKPLCSKEKHDD